MCQNDTVTVAFAAVVFVPEKTFAMIPEHFSRALWRTILPAVGRAGFPKRDRIRPSLFGRAPDAKVLHFGFLYALAK
jgi:hypothetical protein